MRGACDTQCEVLTRRAVLVRGGEREAIGAVRAAVGSAGEHTGRRVERHAARQVPGPRE